MSPSASLRQRAIRSNPSVVPLATATHRHFDASSSRSLGSVPRNTAARTEPGNLTGILRNSAADQFGGVAGGLAAVAGAVVDHPEHPPIGGVGEAGHDLVDQRPKGSMPVWVRNARRSWLGARPRRPGIGGRPPRWYSCSTRRSRPAAGARVGWQRTATARAPAPLPLLSARVQ